MELFRLVLVQLNPTVGDLQGNAQKVVAALEEARGVGADLVIFPELVLTGYPPEDLLLMPSFVQENLACLQQVAGATSGITALVGFVDCRDDEIYNAAAVLHDGEVAAVYHKLYLPNYGVFDEYRYFHPGGRPLVFRQGPATVGVSICEDIWYPAGPVEAEALAGARLIVNISASPYHMGKGRGRERMLATRAADNVAYVAFCNLVGGQDELVFDGGSVVFDPRGELVARARYFEEDRLVVDLDLGTVLRQRLHDPRRRQLHSAAADGVEELRLTSLEPGARAPVPPRIEPLPEPDAEVYRALVLGTQDYVRKNGFRQVVVGLSGGVDSSLVATIAVDALGPENVIGVFMPSRYSSTESREDARAVADLLGIRFLEIPIDEIFSAYIAALAAPFAGLAQDVTEENIQARIRGNLLMALSNKFGWLVLTTGNKSELATGYCTLYGDMAGGFAVLKDVPKTLVYRLARYRNARSLAIPDRVLTKPPSAELRPDQRDEDTLGPYALLDPILQAYVEEDRGLAEIVALGYREEDVRRILRMVDRSEYKRRQAPPGIKITPRAFGRDRRLPITHRFRPSAPRSGGACPFPGHAPAVSLSDHALLPEAGDFLGHVAEVRLQDFLRMLPEERGWVLQPHRGAGKFQGRARNPDAAGRRVRQFDNHPPREDLGVGEHLVDVEDGSARDVCSEECLFPLACRAGAKPFLQDRDEDIAVLHAERVRCEPRVLGEIVPSADRAQIAPLAVVAHSHRDPAVGRGERLVRHDVGVGIPIAFRALARDQVVAAHVDQPGHVGIQERDVDVLSFPAPFPFLQRGEDGDRRVQACRHVDDGKADLHRRPFDRAGDAHDPALGLDDEIVAGAVTVGPGLAVTRDRTVDQTRVPRAQGLIPDSPFVHRAGVKVLHEHVGPLGQPLDDFPAFPGFQVQGDALLPTVHAQVVGSFPSGKWGSPLTGIVPPSGDFDLEHLSSEVGKHHGAVRARQHPGEIEHQQALEGSACASGHP